MNRQEATELATKFSQTWPRGPVTQVWEEELAECDAGRAGTAFAKMRRELEHAPSVAKFFSFYRALHVAGDEPACSQCGGAGAVPPSDPIVVHGRFCASHGGGGCDCTGVAAWCRCPEGRRLAKRFLGDDAA